ncbi:MAG TPA: hypothetical protein VMT91_09275 [Anaerolineales bacterium]|nr:hypothetical protein [Anaerolineales bacterium]
MNMGRIAFHLRMGIRIEPGTAGPDGAPYDPDHDGSGQNRVRFDRQV